MTQRTTHPLVSAYLEELDRLLAGIDPGDRAEVLTGVREHLDSALDGRGQVGDDDVREALAELGPPQAVAEEAYAGRPTPAPTAPPRVAAMRRPWVPVVVALLTAVGLLVVLLVPSAAAGVVSSTSVDSSGVVVETAELSGSPLLTRRASARAATAAAARPTGEPAAWPAVRPRRALSGGGVEELEHVLVLLAGGARHAELAGPVAGRVGVEWPGLRDLRRL